MIFLGYFGLCGENGPKTLGGGLFLRAVAELTSTVLLCASGLVLVYAAGARRLLCGRHTCSAGEEKES